MCKTFITPVLVLSVVVGCAGQQELQTYEAFFSVEVTHDVPGSSATFLKQNPDGVPTLLVRPTHYPACVTHEIRHVFEGEWHGSEPTVCHGPRHADDLARNAISEETQSDVRTSP